MTDSLAKKMARGMPDACLDWVRARLMTATSRTKRRRGRRRRDRRQLEVLETRCLLSTATEITQTYTYSAYEDLAGDGLFAGDPLAAGWTIAMGYRTANYNYDYPDSTIWYSFRRTFDQGRCDSSVYYPLENVPTLGNNPAVFESYRIWGTCTEVYYDRELEREVSYTREIIQEELDRAYRGPDFRTTDRDLLWDQTGWDSWYDGVARVSGAKALYVQLPIIRGTVYEDLNGDGKQDAGELPLANRDVCFESPSVRWFRECDEGTYSQRTTTDAEGRYELKGVPRNVADLVVQVSPSPGFDEIVSQDLIVTSAASRQVVADHDIGIFKRVRVSGTVYVDHNGDGDQDPEDEPRAGVKVYLDSNGDGVFNNADGICDSGAEPCARAITDANGRYVLEGGPALGGGVGPGTVRVLSPSIPPEWYVFTEGADGYALTSGQDIPDANFGLFEAALVYGQVFHDLNLNGRWDHGELPLAGVRIALDLFSDGSIDRETVSDETGGYEFGYVGPGTHQLSQEIGRGVVQTLPTSPDGYRVTITTSSQYVPNYLFGRFFEAFIVNTTDDAADPNLADGRCDTDAKLPGDQCTLRAAIEQAKASPGRQFIGFKIPGAATPTIQIGSSLPLIDDEVSIDGTTQPGAGMVQLQGDPQMLDVEGLDIFADDSIVRGLTIAGFSGAGIVLRGNRNLIEENVIISNGHDGIEIWNGTGNRVRGNRIGIDANGAAAGNAGAGIRVSTSESVIGGTGAGDGNVIAHNGTGPFVDGAAGYGVVVTGGSGNAILGNAIYDNAGLGIDLGFDGVSPNDNFTYAAPFLPDVDQGANWLQNFPDITWASDGRTIEGTLNSTPNTTFRIEFFGNSTPNPLGHGDGATYLGSLNVTTSDSGYALFIGTPFVPSPDQFITATATRILDEQKGLFGDTSEFSPAAHAVRRGVTVITHGFTPEGLSSDPALGDSLLSLAQVIHNRTGGCLLNYDIEAQGGQGSFQADVCRPNVGGSEGQETIVLFDWAVESFEISNGWAEAAGDALFAILVNRNLLEPEKKDANAPYHFISHSMGTAVTSEVVERFAAFGVPVEHLTYLDPHEYYTALGRFDEEQQLFTLGKPRAIPLAFGIPSDPTRLFDEGYGASVWKGVAFADVYYETRGSNGGVSSVFVPEGRPIPGAFSRLLDKDNDLPDLALEPYATDPSGVGGDHSYVWVCFYAATVQGNLPTDCAKPINPDVRTEYARTGYAFSRNAFLPQEHPDPNFYEAGQDHENSDAGLVNRTTGQPNALLLQRADLVTAEITVGRWKPDWDPTTIINGDFEAGPDAQLFASIYPGWSHHGGGGPGGIDGIGNSYLELDAGRDWRTHNWLYVANESPALSLVFDMKVTTASEDDQFNVRLSDTPLGFPMALTDEDWFFESFTTKCLEIPQQLRNQAHTLTFELFSRGGSTEAEVLVDNVRFVPRGCSPGTLQTMQTAQGDIGPGEQQQFTLKVDPSVNRLQVDVQWAGSDLDLELTAPDGTVVTHEVALDDPDVQLDIQSTSESITVDYPLPGEWKVRVIAVDVPAGGEPFQLDVRSDSLVSAVLEFGPEVKTIGDLVSVRVELAAEGAPVTGASVLAAIRPPENAPYEQARLRLFDDGQHNDGAANDGIYGNEFRRAVVPGDYTFAIQTDGATSTRFGFSRLLSASISVIAGADTDGDGLPDAWEQREGTDRFLDDRDLDSDSDGLSNIEEYVLGTKPGASDTDGDGVSDRIEAILNTDPLDAGSWVFDIAPPELNVPPDQIRDASDPGGTAVSYPPVTATDDLDLNPLVQCDPVSGSRFSVGSTTVTCTATDHLGKSSSAIFRITVRFAEWRNLRNPYDVDDDGLPAPLDVLRLINELNGPRFSDPVTRRLFDRPDPELPFFDVNGDGFLTPQDVLEVINFLNFQAVGGEAESSLVAAGWLDSNPISGAAPASPSAVSPRPSSTAQPLHSKRAADTWQVARDAVFTQLASAERRPSFREPTDELLDIWGDLLPLPDAS